MGDALALDHVGRLDRENKGDEDICDDVVGGDTPCRRVCHALRDLLRTVRNGWWWTRGRHVSLLLRWLMRQGRENGSPLYGHIAAGDKVRVIYRGVRIASY